MKKSIYSTKVIQSLILASALCLSTSAFASSDADNGGVAADRGSAALGITESFKTDDSTNVDVAESGNQNDLSTDVAVDVALTDSFNDNSDNSTDDDVVDSFNIKDSFKTDDSVTDSNNLTIGDIAVAVAVSDLEGVVTDNRIDVRRAATVYTGDNTMRDSMTNPAGITQVSMNTGFQSLTQQSVNVQANLGLGQ